MSKGSFRTTTQDRYLGDFVAGAVHEFGPMMTTEDDIVRFGKQFDPQIFHTDPEGSRETVYGGLIAGGWRI
jgi:acyl dehydratase